MKISTRTHKKQYIKAAETVILIFLCVFSNFISYTAWTNQDPCQSRPCQNGGTCSQDGDSYNCVCTSNFEGKHCEHKKCELASGYK